MNLANILATGVLATVGFTVAAQTGTVPAPAATPAVAPHGHRHVHGDPAQRQERFTRRMTELKQKLQITPAQDAAWTSFANALKPAPRQPIDREALARLNTPDRIDQMRAVRSERMAQMDRRSDAIKAFYATLDGQQKKVFDEATAHRGGRGGHHLKG